MYVDCPICQASIKKDDINSHLDNGCVNLETKEKRQIETKCDSVNSFKKQRLQGPLADISRPLKLSEFQGEENNVFISLVNSYLTSNTPIPSFILYGPTGSGKTTIARIIKHSLPKNTYFKELNACIHNISDIKKSFDEAKNQTKMFSKSRAVIFIDEIHRLNKTQQDIFMPQIENGSISLIAATTENPRFKCNPALLSRCKVITLPKYSSQTLSLILKNAYEVKKEASNLKSFPVVPDIIYKEIQDKSDGDARYALNTLEMVLDFALHEKLNQVTKESLFKCLAGKMNGFSDNDHFDHLSALQKSIRGSDPDASLFYLMRMLQNGVDPLVICRRMIVMASEEIGIINPQMLTLAVSTHESARIIGMPECELVLAHCAISLAKSPKNWDVVKAVKRVKLLLEGQGENGEPNILGNAPIPSHLQNRNSNPGSHFSKSYIYPPDDPIGAKNQTYLPEALIGTKFLK